MDLLKKEEQNLVEPLVGLSKVGRGFLEERGKKEREYSD
jgi:hypothetical protein